MGVCEGGEADMISSSSPTPGAKESLFIILRLQCLIIAETRLARGGQEVSPTKCPRPSQERGGKAE